MMDPKTVIRSRVKRDSCLSDVTEDFREAEKLLLLLTTVIVVSSVVVRSI